MTSQIQREPPLTGITGVALAGGMSRRMGRDKAALTLAGRPLVARVVERLRIALAEVLVIGPTSLAALAPNVTIIPDAQPTRGPLGSLATALDTLQTPWIFLVACDLPFLQPALVRHIASLALTTPDVEAVTVRSAGGLEPLHAAYRHDIAPAVARVLTSPHPSMRALLDNLRVREVAPEDVTRLDPSGLSIFNVNTPDDWSRAVHLAEPEANGGL